MSVLTTRPQFLYPHSRQFPFDEVAEKIVRAIEKRNWQVPGLKIEFDTYGSGEDKYQLIRSITGDGFKLYFCRVQGELNSRTNDVAALQSIWIPKQIMEVYSDESGPTYYLYVGNDWEADKEWFMNSCKVNSRLSNEPRRYLRYKGNMYGQRSTELRADNDLNREYSPNEDEPTYFILEAKFNEITAWLEEFVLGYILTFEEASVIDSPTPIEELVPYRGPWSTIYSICSFEDAEKIKKGKENLNELPPEERYVYFGGGHRLVPLNVQCKDSFPEVACNGFIWCDTNQEQIENQNFELLYDVQRAMNPCTVGKYIVAITLKYANEVYVADNSKYEETRQQLFAAIAPRELLTYGEIDEAYASRGATIVPITEYQGGYKEPIVLINRELDFDEVGFIKYLKD